VKKYIPNIDLAANCKNSQRNHINETWQGTLLIQFMPPYQNAIIFHE
jgi:hypothetical protein